MKCMNVGAPARWRMSAECDRRQLDRGRLLRGSLPSAQMSGDAANVASRRERHEFAGYAIDRVLEQPAVRVPMLIGNGSMQTPVRPRCSSAQVLLLKNRPLSPRPGSSRSSHQGTRPPPPNGPGRSATGAHQAERFFLDEFDTGAWRRELEACCDVYVGDEQWFRQLVERQPPEAPMFAAAPIERHVFHGTSVIVARRRSP